MNQVYDRYLGPSWREEPGDHTLWKRAEAIPAEELWRCHERRRERLVSFTRRRLALQLERRGAPRAEIEAADEVLDPDVLTIGFARRFATYKRATVLLRDRARLAAILNNPGCPVQIIFAGKAHPRDGAGKDLIRQIVEVARQKEFRHRIVFIENYDMAVSRYLVQGVDVWLNTPLRPLEASGTSGMKAAVNGTLNLSTLDGWWDEAWRGPDADGGRIGWSIGNGESYDDPEYQNQVESEALYDLLEKEVVPAFYDRGTGKLPRRWIERMQASIGNLCYFFNTHRMVREYTERFYDDAHAHYRGLSANNAERARSLAKWLARVREAWPQVRAEILPDARPAEVRVGAEIRTRALVRLGVLRPDDVAVELYAGRLNSRGEIQDAVVKRMEPSERENNGAFIFETAAIPKKSGRHGYTVRVTPHHADLADLRIPGLIVWAGVGGVSNSA
jgi:starch phosphorylase